MGACYSIAMFTVTTHDVGQRTRVLSTRLRLHPGNANRDDIDLLIQKACMAGASSILIQSLLIQGVLSS